MRDKALKYISIAALLYVGVLIMLSYTEFQNVVFRGIAELITIPTIMFVIGCFLFSVFKVMRKDKSYIIIALINFSTIVLAVVSSILE